MLRPMLRLVLLLVCVGLAASRLGLLAHELVGHGGATLALGGHISEVRLFWFAGGWIRYELSEPTIAGFLVVAMGGIAVELVAGTALWFAARGDTLGARLVRGAGATLWVHAAWYLATGAWHGYGDGTLLYRELGDARWPFAIAVGLGACTAAFLGARWVAAAIAATLPARRVAGTIAAVILAGAVNGGLVVGELAVRRDVVYRETMAPERDRLIARELATWVAEHQPSEAEREAQARALAEAHRTFPFALVLAIALAAAGIAGALRSGARPYAPIARRVLARAAILAIASVGAVIAISIAVES